MDKASPISENELRLLESLHRHGVRFMMVGLSAAAMQGAPVVTEDVDLWFEDLNDPQLGKALRAVGAGYVPPFGLNPPMLAGAYTEPFDVVLRMSGLGQFADELAHTKEIRLGRLRFRVLSLERILVSKRAADRPKDRLVIPVLENTIRTLQAKEKRKRGTKRNQEAMRKRR